MNEISLSLLPPDIQKRSVTLLAMTAEARQQNKEKLTSARGHSTSDDSTSANWNVTRLTVKGLSKYEMIVYFQSNRDRNPQGISFEADVETGNLMLN